MDKGKDANMHKNQQKTGLIWLWLALVVLILDMSSKLWVVNHLTFGEPFTITSFFNLTLAFNKGAAFSFLDQQSGWQHAVFGGLAIIVSIYIVWLLYESKRSAAIYNFALALVLGGALGNLIDRVRYGYVIDFFDFHWHQWHFAIFNVADSAICVGAFLLAIVMFRKNN